MRLSKRSAGDPRRVIIILERELSSAGVGMYIERSFYLKSEFIWNGNIQTELIMREFVVRTNTRCYVLIIYFKGFNNDFM